MERCWHGLKPSFTPEGLPRCADDAVSPEEGIKSFPSGHTSWSTSGAGGALQAGRRGAGQGAGQGAGRGGRSRGSSRRAPAAVASSSCLPASSPPGLGFATFWLLGKLRCFDGSAAPARFAVALLPLLGAAWIGLSRIQDYWWVQGQAVERPAGGLKSGRAHSRGAARLARALARGGLSSAHVPAAHHPPSSRLPAAPAPLPRCRHHWEDVACGFALGLLMAWLHYRTIYPSVFSPHAGQLTSALRGGPGSSGARLAPSASRTQLLGDGGGDEYSAGDDKV